MSCVEQAKGYLQHPDDQKELQLINEFVLREQFQKLLRIHNKIVETDIHHRLSSPVTSEAQLMHQSVLLSLSEKPYNDLAIELMYILKKPNLKVGSLLQILLLSFLSSENFHLVLSSILQITISEHFWGHF